MSYIPSHAMPHTYVHEDDRDENGRKRSEGGANLPTALKLVGAALAGLFVYRVLR